MNYESNNKLIIRATDIDCHSKISKADFSPSFNVKLETSLVFPKHQCKATLQLIVRGEYG